MAEPKIPKEFQMPELMRKQLGDLKAQIDGANISIAALKKIGMDTKALEDKLTWAEETRKILLSTFAPKE